MQNFTSAITYSSPDGPTPDSLPPLPESVRSAFGRHNQIFLDGLITKAMPQSYGAPLAWSSAKIKRNYFKLCRFFFKLIKQWRGEVVTSRCIMKAVIRTSQAQFGDQFIHVGPGGWIWVNFRDRPPFIFGSCIVAFFRSVQNHCGSEMWSPTLSSAGRVTLQARLTFCFSRKQFTTFCKEMSLLPMTTFLHRNGALGKEQLLGSKSRPVTTHMATPSCIATLHQLNWTTVRKQPTFFTTNTGFPVKWRLRNDCRNFILLRCQYLVLGSASDWSWVKGKLQSEALLRSG